MESKKHFCKNIMTIPQFNGTCWFNAILMAVFYSQNSRKVLLNICDTWETKNNKFLMICKEILLKYYIYSKEAVLFFNKFKPEAIIFYMLKYFEDKVLKQRLKQFIRTKGYNNLSNHSYYIINIYKNLGVKCLDITYLKDSNTYLLNFYKNLNLIYNKNLKVKEEIDFSSLSFSEEEKEIRQLISDVPDILILNHSDFSSKFTSVINYTYNQLLEKNKFLAGIYDKDYYHDIIIKGLDEYKDEIEFNGRKYKLDSCLLNSYSTINPKNTSSHLIAGLTCKNVRFVYNGWDKEKTDEEKIFDEDTYIACPLIGYNWDLNHHKEVCFLPKKCNLFRPIETNFCFSFNKITSGTLIYVRINEPNKSKDIDDIKEKLSLSSNFSKIVKDMHDIKTLSEEELIEQLKAFDVNIEEGQKPTKKELQKMLYDKLTEFFRIYINDESSEEKKKRERISKSSSSSKRKLKKYKLEDK